MLIYSQPYRRKTERLSVTLTREEGGYLLVVVAEDDHEVDDDYSQALLDDKHYFEKHIDLDLVRVEE